MYNYYNMPANSTKQKTKNSKSRYPVYDANKPYTAKNLAAPQIMSSVGYISVGVYTALGALPIENATVTVFYNEDDTEKAVTYFKTGIDGQTPLLEVPVEYDPNMPNMDPVNYYTTYNVRVSADNFHTVDVSDVQVYPKTKTLLEVNMVPVTEGEPLDSPGLDVVIPPHGLSAPIGGGDR